VWSITTSEYLRPFGSLHKVGHWCILPPMTRTPVAELEWRLCDRMRRSLDYAGIGVQEMADYLLRSRNAVGNWLSGRTAPSERVLRRWAELTGVSYEWLDQGRAPESEPAEADRRAPSGLRKRSSGCTIDTWDVRRYLTVVPLGEADDEDVAA
jgi:transcriptional regulator with XRE-family HTH domain